MPDPINVVLDDIQPIFNIPPEFIKPVKINKPTYEIFWGGADVDPSLYNRKKSNWCSRTNPQYDKKELDRMLYAIDNGIPIIGICRGAQLLNVANGGILVQHIEDHTMKHTIEFTYKGSTWKDVEVSSTHHQMMIPTKDAVILGRSFEPVEGRHWDNVNDSFTYPHVNEVIYYPKTKSLCIQPHPEWMDQNSLFISLLNMIINRELKLDPINFQKASQGEF